MTPEERAAGIVYGSYIIQLAPDREAVKNMLPVIKKQIADAIRAAVSDETAHLQHQLSLSQAAVKDLQQLLQAAEQRQARAVAAEREACKTILAEKRRSIQKTYYGIGTWNMIQAILAQMEAAIRARGEAEDETDA